MQTNYLRYMLSIMVALLPLFSSSQIRLLGTVQSAHDHQVLKGASVKLKYTQQGTTTDDKGQFSLIVNNPGDTVVIRYLGYHTKEWALNKSDHRSAEIRVVIELESAAEVLDEIIVSTGYYQIPKERATGSFTQIDQKLFNRSVGADVLSRLEGVTNSLHFDRRSIIGENAEAPELRVRGLSTLFSEQSPLIILDNFPYEGDVEQINPNDVESITILKDAAAASIWGARAGNGVIVINTKKGTYNEKSRINVNSNASFIQRPNLKYQPKYLSAVDFIEVERELFSRNFYTGDIMTAYTPVVELLFKQKQGTLTHAQVDAQIEKYNGLDIRDQARKYLYQNGVSQQYALNLNGGSQKVKYYLSGGLDDKTSNIRGNSEKRFTLNSMNTFQPVDHLEITAGLYFQQGDSKQNGLGMTAINPQSRAAIYPYAQLADSDGKALPLERRYRTTLVNDSKANGLDWAFRPLEELELNDQLTQDRELRLISSLRYRLLKGLDVDLKYQYQWMPESRTNLRSAQSYYVRDLINTFTAADGTKVFPQGSILTTSQLDKTAQFGRAQLNYQTVLGQRHALSVLSGMELRQVQTTGSNNELYGYDSDVLSYTSLLNFNTLYATRPLGSQARIPVPYQALTDLVDRFISYYANASYSYKSRYTISSSSRWDASNLFGVKTNQKGVPLWSAGASWNISEEPFYDFSYLSTLKFRATYGLNGNINKSVTAYPTALYSRSALTGLPTAILRNPGDPNLRWERIQIVNLGLDFQTKGQRISGSLEYYDKKGSDLLGDVLTDPTTGFFIDRTTLATKRVNYANIRTRGVDVDLQARVLEGGIQWTANLLFSYVANKVTRYNGPEGASIVAYMASAVPVRQGVSPDALYSIPWKGLNPQTGGPLILIEGQPSNNYGLYYNGLRASDLRYNGEAVPPYFGSMRHTFQWRDIELGINLSWKSGYYFRGSSINYYSLFNQWVGHADYQQRWRQPGDEQFTQVPSMPSSSDLNRDQLYTYSDLLVEPGDHIRLQDISLNYTLPAKKWQSMPVKNVQLYAYARDLGILWRRNAKGLDPDYPNASYPNPSSFSLGLRAGF